MSKIRFTALEKALNRLPFVVEFANSKISDYYGINVFDLKKMKQYLSEEAFQSVMESIDGGVKIQRNIADQVASGMKSWAIERGATHYTHWFQPLTGETAEKHDAFLKPDNDGSAIEVFSGSNLVQQEPDASSFPSGGLRNTFEARGYTAWDPSSPAFIVGNTLCIPTIFVSYTGEALDFKTPLLRSIAFLDKAATEVCHYFDKSVTKVHTTLGIEQEYFLVDSALYQARPDLILTGRTLMGHTSAKDQQLEDHYFGSIPERVLSFMKDFEYESHKLGIPLTTRHNEVAPNQFECAPMFEETNIAVDHNQLMMDIMKKVAARHNFVVLLHEKPYKGVNGSGKHNNWSLRTNTGKNLLSPGKTPNTNLQFLTFLVNIVKAVFDNTDLLRASIASAGNEHRLGANEAPPAIISVFLGTQLNQILDEIESKVSDNNMTSETKSEMKIDIGRIPEILLDNTDRNRTSPFAFTGNRFEFRAVGSSANSSAPMLALNTAVGNQLLQFKKDVDELINKEFKNDDAILKVLRRYIIQSKAVRFEGNGYGDEWKEEARRRGLTNIVEAVEAFGALIQEKTINLFAESGVLNHRELEARYEIKLETYIKKIQIESRVLGDLASNHVLPTAIRYQNLLLENVKGIKECICDEWEKIAKTQIATVKEISSHITEIQILVEEMVESRKKANRANEIREKAKLYAFEVKPYLEKIRYHIDKLELIVDDEIWTLPKYRELLFVR